MSSGEGGIRSCSDLKMVQKGIFSWPVGVYRKSCCTTISVGSSGGSMDKMLKFYVKVF